MTTAARPFLQLVDLFVRETMLPGLIVPAASAAAAVISAVFLVSGSAAVAGDRVTIAGFAIDRTEVTIARFRAYIAAAGQPTAAERAGGGFEYVAGWTRRPGWTWAAPYGEAGGDDEPAVHVTWAEAQAYCKHRGGRLPTFVEWSRAAYEESRSAPADGFVRGRTYTYPVGEDPDGMNAGARRHVAVATTRRGVNGLYDMGANVWEWIADRRGDQALTAGGSWWYGPSKTRRDGAQWKSADFYAVYIGFRCAYDPAGSAPR